MTNYTRQSERMPDSLKKKKRKPKPKRTYSGIGRNSVGSVAVPKRGEPGFRGKVATKPKAKPRPKAKKPKTTRRGR